MPSNATREAMRVFYLKDGDAVDEVRRSASSDVVDHHGPDIFVNSFLHEQHDAEIWVMARSRQRSSFRAQGIRADEFNGGSSRIAKLFLRPIAFFRILFAILRWRPQRVLCGSTGDQLLACLIGARLCRATLVHARHNRVDLEPIGLRRTLSSSLEKWMLRRIPAAIAHGPYLADQLRETGVAPSRVFEFEVNFPEDTPFRNSDTEESATLLFLGRVEISKGVLDLLEAAAPVLAKQPNAVLEYLGDGGALHVLTEEARRSPVSNQVRVGGPIPHDRVLDRICDALVVITPTRSLFPEGRCMAVLESLVVGVPVIAPDFGPFPYLIEHGVNGLLYKPDSIQELRSSIERIVGNKDLADTLRDGARITSNELRRRRPSFGEATQTAFQTCELRRPCFEQ